MDNIFTNIFEFVVNKTHNVYHKALFFLSAIIILVVLDNTLNFTSSYNNIRRYEQMQAINSIISDTTLSNSDRKILKQNRSNILIHKTWKDKTYQFFNSIDFNFSKQNNEVTPSNNVPIGDPTHPEVKPAEKEKIANDQRNYWVHFVTSSWTIVLCMIFLPFIPFFAKKADIKGAILGIPIFELFFYILAWSFAKVLSFIPIILNNVNYNYALNFAIHTAIIFVLGYITNKNQKRRKS
ncbi:MAG: hypothetical protein K0S24_3741 [Sphingobacterium sp.]|jgi:hypothetical protein|nr:hypothetical protein [Sphingobacterium sp.]